MSVLLYAVAECAPGEFPAGDLRVVGAERLGAVVRDLDGPAPSATEESLWEYERVMEALMDRLPILPLRFGSTLSDEEAVANMLRAHRDELSRALEKVRGAVEVAVSAYWRSTPCAASARTGTAYMEEQLALTQRASRAVSRLAPLAAVARSSRIRKLPRSDTAALGAYLVQQTRLKEFCGLVEQLDAELDELDLVCTGPWPAYSFAADLTAAESVDSRERAR